MRRVDLRTFAGGVVLFMWSASGIDALIRHDYTVLQYVTPVMGIFAGWLWGIEIVRGRNGSPQPPPSAEPPEKFKP